MWFMLDAHLGLVFLFLAILAEFSLLSTTVMVTILSNSLMGSFGKGSLQKMFRTFHQISAEFPHPIQGKIW